MATGLIRDNTRIAIKEEVTEGTYVPPSAATDYIQPLEDGFDLTPGKELVERNPLTGSIGQITPRTGIKSATATLPVEFRASGTEGGAPDFDLLLKGALGDSRAQGSQTTSGTGHTASQINLSGATIGNFSVGDGIIILEAGDHSIHTVSVVDTTGGSENITILPARSGAPTDNVLISQFQTYFPADTGHPAISVSEYWGNEVRQAAVGSKVTSMSIDNFSTGQIASFNFSLEGLFATEVDGASPQTPSFDSALPPLILNACVYQNGTQIDVNTFSLSLTNTLRFVTSTCDSNGRISSRVTNRAITGSIDPYKDDTTTTYFDQFDATTQYSLVITAYNPSTVAGEIELGSGIVIYLPTVITTEFQTADLDGILVDNLSFQAVAGNTGDQDDIYISMI